MRNLNEKDTKFALNLLGVGAATAGTTALIATQPANAAVPTSVTAAVTDIQDTMGALGTLAAAALAVVLGVIGIYFGIGYGKKIMAKG